MFRFARYGLLVLGLLTAALVAGSAWAQSPVIESGWSAFIIRGNATEGLPLIEYNDNYEEVATEFVTFASSQKAGLGTNMANGALVSEITTLHVDRLDDPADSGSLWGPYFNIWVTDGLGHYAVIANEPSNPEWSDNRWDVTSWDELKTKTCKVYETPGASTGTSWLHVLIGNSGPLTFEDVGGLTIAPPPPAYIQDSSNLVGTGAPDELGTDVAYGYNWIFGDTMANYVTGDEGFVVSNYSITTGTPVHNVTQGLYYTSIGAALAEAVEGDEIAVSDGFYNEDLNIAVGVDLHSVNGAGSTTIGGMGGTLVNVNADNVEISGFTLTNSLGVRAIATTDHGDLYIHDNVITGIGNSALESYVHALAVVCTAQDMDDIVIEDNTFSNIEAGPYSSASAVTVGWSTGTFDVTGLVIRDNVIDHVRSNTSAWNVGHGAYGILLNHSGNVDGEIVDAVISGNTVNDLEGLWAHGIGLEGNTPGAVVSGNTVTNLVDHKTPSDAIAVFFEANASAGTVTVTGNTFGNVSWGVASVVVGAGLVDATGNDWGSASGPYSEFANPVGTGCGVGGQILFTPWTGRTTSVVADLGVAPTSPALGTDGYGYWEGTPALGLDGEYASGFDPGALQANVTAADAEKYTKYGLSPEVIFGRPVHVAELHSISYFTSKDTEHNMGNEPDWFVQMYTNGTAHGWYGERINSEPYFSESIVETPGQWTRWQTSAGQNNRLRFFDSNIDLGGYDDGFLQEMATDPYYGPQTLMLFGLATGSGWAEGFEGMVDGLTIELVSGEIATFNFISGNAVVTTVPATSGPLMCGQTQTLTFKLTTDQYTDDVFGYNAVVRFSEEVTALTSGVHDLKPFTDDSETFYAVDQGDGSFYIAGSTVGSPTYPITEPGTYDLFSIDFITADDGDAAITFDSFLLRDPFNAPLATNPTGATITVDCTAPAAVTGVTTAPHHNRVEVNWTHDGTDVDHYVLYRGLVYDTAVGTSAYPEYNDLPGYSVPTRPSTPTVANTSGEWAHVADLPVGTNTIEDNAMTTGRGIYYYEVFAVDAAGNTTAAANNDASTNYWLGDVDGTGEIDPLTDMDDLGQAFGTVDGGEHYNACCDVGPTDDWSRVGLPLTDSRVDFEDLMIFAMNYGVVDATNKSQPVIDAVAQLSWVTYGEGRYALRLEDGAGVKGVRVTLPESEVDVTVDRVSAGDLLDRQNELTFLRNVGEGLDVNVAVMGRGQGFRGEGDLFVLETSAPVSVDELVIEVRGSDNRRIDVSLATSSDTLTPRVFALQPNFPNPFNPQTKISFSLPEPQDVRLTVYSIDGRKVATLVNETRSAGLHEVLWTGRDDGGRSVASGTYFYRIDAGPYSQVRKMTLMK